MPKLRSNAFASRRCEVSDLLRFLCGAKVKLAEQVSEGSWRYHFSFPLRQRGFVQLHVPIATEPKKAASAFRGRKYLAAASNIALHANDGPCDRDSSERQIEFIDDAASAQGGAQR
jgi:hypothetical protein